MLSRDESSIFTRAKVESLPMLGLIIQGVFCRILVAAQQPRTPNMQRSHLPSKMSQLSPPLNIRSKVAQVGYYLRRRTTSVCKAVITADMAEVHKQLTPELLSHIMKELGDWNACVSIRIGHVHNFHCMNEKHIWEGLKKEIICWRIQDRLKSSLHQPSLCVDFVRLVIHSSTPWSFWKRNDQIFK